MQRQHVKLAQNRKKPRNFIELRGFLLEAGIGIEPVYTALQAAA